MKYRSITWLAEMAGDNQRRFTLRSEYDLALQQTLKLSQKSKQKQPNVVRP